MSIAEKREAFCRRVKAVQSMQAVETGGQSAFQTSQGYEEWTGRQMPGMCKQVAPGASEEKTGQSVEVASLPTKAVSGS